MCSRWTNLAIIVLWLLSMGWLVRFKLIPDWLVGDPPDYARIVAAQRDEPTVGWNMFCNNRPMGWAISRTKVYDGGLVEISSHVRFWDLHGLERQSLLAKALLQLISGDRHAEIDARSMIRIDSLGNLLDFDSSLWHGHDMLVHISGQAESGQLRLSVFVGASARDRIEQLVPLPPRSVMSDALSPQSQLPDLRLHQQWTVPVYNPIMPSQPLEILHASVDSQEPYPFNGETVPVWVVVYRGGSTTGTSSDRSPRGRLWVHQDGTVLKQEATFLDVTLKFTRTSPSETELLEKHMDAAGANRPLAPEGDGAMFSGRRAMRTGAGTATHSGSDREMVQDVAEPVPVFVTPPTSPSWPKDRTSPQTAPANDD